MSTSNQKGSNLAKIIQIRFLQIRLSSLIIFLLKSTQQGKVNTDNTTQLQCSLNYLFEIFAPKMKTSFMLSFGKKFKNDRWIWRDEYKKKTIDFSRFVLKFNQKTKANQKAITMSVLRLYVESFVVVLPVK